jgi:hypothetical protein
MKSIVCALHLLFALALALPRADAQTAMLEDIYVWQPAGINDCSSYLISFPAKSALLILYSQRPLPNDEHTRKPWLCSPQRR